MVAVGRARAKRGVRERPRRIEIERKKPEEGADTEEGEGEVAPSNLM